MNPEDNDQPPAPAPSPETPNRTEERETTAQAEPKLGPVGGYGIELPPGTVPKTEVRGPTDSVALATFLIGLLGLWSLPCCYPLALMSSASVLLLGTVALQRIRSAPEPASGKWLALSGMAMGTIPALLFLLFIIYHWIAIIP